MVNSLISENTLQFLRDVRDNNNRPWFDKNKERYRATQSEGKMLLNQISDEMNKIDQIEKNKLFRIYRDVRFSHDKTPYNFHMSMSLSRQKPYLRGGYYLRIKPEESVIAVGFWNPAPADLRLIRQNIDFDAKSFRKAINARSIKSCFGPMEGETVKTSPKGFSIDHADIDLLRHKQFLFSRAVSDHEVVSDDFLDIIISSFVAIRPFFDHMSDILTHNINGEPLY